MFVIIVDFLIKENEVENFKPLMLENARASLMDEPGCRQFDVCFDIELSESAFCMRFMTVKLLSMNTY